MSWSRVRQNASCRWTAMVRTVTRPSYTLCCSMLSQASRWALPLPGAGCSSSHLQAAIRHWLDHCLSLFDSASVCVLCSFAAAQVNQMATRLPCRPDPCHAPATATATDAARRLRRPWRPPCQPQPSDLAQPSPARQPIWGTATSAASWRSPGLIKPATNTHADSVRRMRLHMALFPLVPTASAAYVRSTSSSFLTHASPTPHG
jgi:hypothetical protein